MKKIIILLCIAAVGLLSMAANRQNTSSGHAYAFVDTDPAAAGFWTASVNVKRETSRNNVKDVYFSYRGTGSIVTLQFKCTGDADWSDYATYTTVTRVVIGDSGDGVLWRAGVKDADYSSGNTTFGFDW